MESFSIVTWLAGVASMGVGAVIVWLLRRPTDAARFKESYAKAADTAWSRLNTLEIKVNALELEVIKRDRVIGQQQVEIDRLRQEVVILRARLESAASEMQG
jgi:uncharacterized coiled-coil protein SlyX